MLTFTYQNPWVATYAGDERDIAWLKRIFTYTDFSDTFYKGRFGHFPSYCTLDGEGQRMSHGQVIHAVRQARTDSMLIRVQDNTQRYLLGTGRIRQDFLPGIKAAYDYQTLSAEIALAKGQGLITIGTGGGKTVVLGIVLKILAEQTTCEGILVLIYSKDLLNQTASRMKEYGIPETDIGVIHSDIPPAKQLEASTKRIVLSTHTSIEKFQGVIQRTRYVLNDEAHRSTGPKWSAIFGKLPNVVNVLGFTATPWDDEGERQKMLAIYGQELVNIPTKYLINRGVLMRPESYFIRIHYKDRDIELCKKMSWQNAVQQFILHDRTRNLLPIAALKKFGGRMLVIYNDLDHGTELQSLYEKSGYETMLAEGKTSTKNRGKAIEWFERDCDRGQDGKVLLASKVFDEGVDIKGGCDQFFAIGAGCDRKKVMQRMGRALRRNRSGRIRTWDTQDANHGVLSKWSGQRRGFLAELGIEPKIISLEEFVALT